jgi:hypothetical protein
VRYGKPGEPTKNGRARDIPILPLARVALDLLPKTHEMVLPSVTGAFRAKGQVFDRIAWKAWLTAAGLKRRVRPHDLRHTCATLLLTGAWGDPWTYEAVKEMLGHSSVKVTERYARATGTLAQRAAASMVDKPETSPQLSASDRAQAAKMIQRRGSDSNRRMTVLQTVQGTQDLRIADAVSGLSRAYLEGDARGEPVSVAERQRLADLAWELADAVRAADVPTAESA